MVNSEEKKQYVPPRLTSVSFQVESGFNSSFGRTFHLLPPDVDAAIRYGEAANSGANFWGGNSPTTPSSSSYSEYDWHWN